MNMVGSVHVPACIIHYDMRSSAAL